MTTRLSTWFHHLKEKKHEITLDDVTPLHPEDYPAKHLKEMLDHRRADFSEHMSHPTGMQDGHDL